MKKCYLLAAAVRTSSPSSCCGQAQQGEWLRWSLFPFAAVVPSVVAKAATVRWCVPPVYAAARSARAHSLYTRERPARGRSCATHAIVDPVLPGCNPAESRDFRRGTALHLIGVRLPPCSAMRAVMSLLLLLATMRYA